MCRVDHRCKYCAELIQPLRYELGYATCIRCGDIDAQKVIHTIVPMHKSNYTVITDKRDLMGINNKGGFYR